MTRRNAQGVTVGYYQTTTAIHGFALSGSTAASIDSPGAKNTLAIGSCTLSLVINGGTLSVATRVRSLGRALW